MRKFAIPNSSAIFDLTRLLLIHGGGLVMKYSIRMVLLDKNDPSKVLARSSEPLVRPEPNEREGYAPNVGAMHHRDRIILPRPDEIHSAADSHRPPTLRAWHRSAGGVAVLDVAHPPTAKPARRDDDAAARAGAQAENGAARGFLSS